jgi:hypothetical protein
MWRLTVQYLHSPRLFLIFPLKLTFFLSETIKCMRVAKLVRSSFSAFFAYVSNIDFCYVLFSTTLQHFHVHRPNNCMITGNISRPTCTFNHLFNYTCTSLNDLFFFLVIVYLTLRHYFFFISIMITWLVWHFWWTILSLLCQWVYLFQDPSQLGWKFQNWESNFLIFLSR